MTLFRISEAAAGLGAAWAGADASVAGVSIDTRRIAAGDLYVALRGARFDGHDFIEQAARAGAVAALVDADWAARQGTAVSLPLVMVKDSRLGLGDLARWWRNRLATMPMAAITGSSGKTTVKEMTAAILAQAAGDGKRVLATTGNLNNDIGMPLTLLRVRPTHRYAVLEMGMNHPGEISYMTNIARPNVTLINNAQPVHLEGLGSVEAVARAKGEILEGLQMDGVAVLNGEDAHLPLWLKLAGARRVMTFALKGTADVRGDWTPTALGGQLAVESPAGRLTVQLQVPGEHNARNALAACAVALALGVAPDAIRAGLEGFAGVAGRLQQKIGLNGALIIDDTYNANPASMLAAMQVLAARPGRTVMVVGDMGELGPDGVRFHAELGHQAKALGIGRLEALGDLAQAAVDTFGAGARHHDSAETLAQAVCADLGPEVTVLVKGSRFMRMERVVALLGAEGAAAH